MMTILFPKDVLRRLIWKLISAFKEFLFWTKVGGGEEDQKVPFQIELKFSHFEKDFLLTTFSPSLPTLTLPPPSRRRFFKLCFKILYRRQTTEIVIFKCSLTRVFTSPVWLKRLHWGTRYKTCLAVTLKPTKDSGGFNAILWIPLAI